MTRAYYNEIDPAAAAVLRLLIAEGVIASGDVDTRSIKDVTPDDLVGYTQCHFFAGAGLWSVAARLAGWPDARPLWSGSCPCQPFSVAGKGGGANDPRHLWPDFFRLIRECRPPVVFGEQVSSAAGKRMPVDENVQSMWAGETLLGFLQDAGQARQFEWLARTMQDVLPGMAGEISDWLEGAEVGFFQEIPGEEPRHGAGYGRALSRKAGWAGVQSGRVHGRNSSEDRPGAMRTDRPPVFAKQREGMGQPVDRPDHPGTWLRHHEHSDRAVFGQRDDEHMGAGANLESCGRHQSDAGRGREAPALPVGAEPEEASCLDWLDGVRADLDTIDYSLGVTDIPACAVDAPHIRQRLYWCAVANRLRTGRNAAPFDGICGETQSERPWDGESERLYGAYGGLLGDSLGAGLEGHAGHVNGAPGWREPTGSIASADGSDGIHAEWIICHDGKARRAKPGVCLLVDGFPGRIDVWRLAGNAIVPQLAAEAIGALIDVLPEWRAA